MSTLYIISNENFWRGGSGFWQNVPKKNWPIYMVDGVHIVWVPMGRRQTQKQPKGSALLSANNGWVVTDLLMEDGTCEAQSSEHLGPSLRQIPSLQRLPQQWERDTESVPYLKPRESWKFLNFQTTLEIKSALMEFVISVSNSWFSFKRSVHAR